MLCALSSRAHTVAISIQPRAINMKTAPLNLLNPTLGSPYGVFEQLYTYENNDEDYHSATFE